MINKDRPKVLQGNTYAVATPCGKFYLTLNYEENELLEVIMRIGKSGNCARNCFEVIGIAFSILLQSGIGRERLKEIMKKHFKGTNCGNTFKYDGKDYTGCIDFTASLIYEEKIDKKTPEPVKDKV